MFIHNGTSTCLSIDLEAFLTFNQCDVINCEDNNVTSEASMLALPSFSLMYDCEWDI